MLRRIVLQALLSALPVLAALAFILSLAALGARMVLPRIAGQRAQIEDYLGGFLGRPVTVESVRAAWDGWDPRLVLTGLSVLNGETLRPAMGFERVVVGIDVWASLGRRQLQLRGLALSGAEFTVARTRGGELVIEGIDGTDARMLRWLLRQPQVAIEGTRIRWHDHQTRHGAWALPYARLDSTGATGRQGFKLTLRLPPDVGKRLLISMSGTGEPFDRDWNADFYAETEDIGPALLTDYQPSIRIRQSGGAIKLRTWGVWRNGQVSEVAGEFKTGGFAVGAGENRFEMVATSGRFLARASPGGGWRIGADRVAIATPEGSWPEARFGLALAPPDPPGARRLIAYASHIELADLSRVLVLSESVPEESKTLLGRLQPRGLLREVELAYHPGRSGAARFYLKAGMDSVSVQRSPAIPGLERLSGVLETDAEKGRLRLSGGPLQIDAVPHFNAPLRLESTSGEVGWHALADGWRIYTPGLKVENPDLRLRIMGDLVMREGRAADARLWAGIDKGRLGGMAKYLPSDLPSKGREWLSQALQAGTIGSGAVVLRGPLDRFPFDRDEGRFAAEINLTGGVLEYSKHWPRIENIDAQVTLDGRELRVAARTATTYGVRLGDVSAGIPDLGGSQRHVIVRGRASGTASDMQRFVSNSPLRSGVGRRIAPLEIGGEAWLDLDMDIPLYPRKATVAGALTFPGNTLKSGPYALTDLRGTLRFAGGAWSSEGLRARLFERAILLETKGGARDRGGGWVKARGRADWPTIEQHLRTVLPSKYHDYFSRGRLRVAAGETGWEARLRLPESARPAELQVHSPMTGMRIDLPAPFGKAAATAAPLTLTSSLHAAGTRDIAVAYGERMRARLALRTGAQPIAGARIYFGPREQASVAGVDYWIGGQLEQLSLTDWQSFSRRWGAGRSAPVRIPENLSIDLSVAKLEGLGFVFKDLRLRATQENRRWRIDTDGPDARGSIRLPGAHPGGMLEASFTRLKLVPSRRVRDPGEIDPRRLPAVSITCEDFSYGSSALGALRVQARPGAAGLSLPKVSFTRPDFSIDAAGSWRTGDSGRGSRFDIKVRAQDLSKLLKTFGYHAVALEGGATAFDIHARWPGDPADFQLSRLSGTLDLKVSDGRLLDVDQGVGRIFGLVSMHAIRRLLQLNLVDLFKTGFAYDEIKGKFMIASGNAYTGGLVMKGPSGRVEVAGRTGLATQDYDQIVTVTPALAGSLPAAGAFFGPVGLGAGAAVFLAEQVFTEIPENINKMWQRRYKLTGSWNAPVVERIEGTPVPQDATKPSAKP
ncbi:MAG: YhdP family protein [Gammaproteobacteria bacterium]